ncbi:SH3-like domain-containing protein [Thioalkalivibrio thiocyanodenitrificans]|uniref:SH3-like domain-containing protein n=1 Tax=Thioalkalivibrio thiocyanodenitrificans TaxID=243063 RepID=UPI0006870049|nr:SH3-like domain-containing protein [Thioalkalivibrio thiocyanodenitrificans]
MRRSRFSEISDEGSGKATGSPKFSHLQIAEIAAGVGDPQCYRGMAGTPPRFKVSDRLRVKDQPDIFYNQTPGYIRGIIGTVTEIAYESPAPEDEAWGHIDKVEWFYVLCFRHGDIWEDDSPDTNPNDTIQAQVSERWLEPA